MIFKGLVEIAPMFAPAFLGLCYVHVQSQSYDLAVQAARKAHKIDPDSVEAELFLAANLLTVGDFNTAGSLLGEIGEKIENGKIDNPEVVRFFQIQMARFETRK